MAFSIMYSPYFEQTLAAFVYLVLCGLVHVANSNRKVKTTRLIWVMMCGVIFFLIMSALLEVGQANFNKIENECFAVGYKPLY